jgi:hypothetical protein
MSATTITIGEAPNHEVHDRLDSSTSSTCDYHSDGSGHSYHNELSHMMRSSSITTEAGNPRGRSRQRSDYRRKKRGDNVDGAGDDEKMLRTKFEIEGMYEEIYKLKRENEELWRIWERVRRTSPARASGGGGAMQLRRSSPDFSGGMRTTQPERQQVPCMVQVGDASDNMVRASGIDCNSVRDCE